MRAALSNLARVSIVFVVTCALALFTPVLRADCSFSNIDCAIFDYPNIDSCTGVGSTPYKFEGVAPLYEGLTIRYGLSLELYPGESCSNVVMYDLFASPQTITCPFVPPGSGCAQSVYHEVTAEEVAAGEVNNNMSISGTSNLAGFASTTYTVRTVGYTYGVQVFKAQTGTTNPGRMLHAGDKITYLVTAVNFGNNLGDGITINDSQIVPSETVCPSVSSGDTCTLIGVHTVSAADVANASVSNQASAISQTTGKTSFSNHVVTPVSASRFSMSVSMAPPDIADSLGSSDAVPGDILTYTVTATNTGYTPLTNVQVGDPLSTPSTSTCPYLASGADCDLVGLYVVTSADAIRGLIENQGYASANEVPLEYSNTVSTPVAAGTLSVSKDLASDNDANGVVQGDVLTFVATATNTSGYMLTDVVVNDAKITPSTASCPNLGINADCVLTGTYTVTAVDSGNGTINNTATATSAEGASGVDTLQVPVSVSSPGTGLSALSLSKRISSSSSSGAIGLGDILTYTVVARNSGRTSLNNVRISDPLITPSSSTCSTIAIGEKCVLIGTYTIGATDITRGFIVNTATASSTEVVKPVVATIKSKLSGKGAAASVSVMLTNNADQDSSGNVSSGDTLTYAVTATNTGNASLTNLVVKNPLTTPNATVCTSVSIGGVCTLIGTYTVTDEDAYRGSIKITGSAMSSQVQSVSASVETTVYTNSPKLSVEKVLAGNTDSDGPDNLSQGDVVTYTATATNTGNVTLTNVAVIDHLTTPSLATCASVAVGATCTLTGSYTVGAQDAANGSISNTAEVSATETPIPVRSTVNTNVFTDASHISPGASGINAYDLFRNRPAIEGDVLAFTITAANTGNTPLTGVRVNDAVLVPNSITCQSVAVGANCVLTGNYTVTAADSATGLVANSGSITSNEVPGPIHSPTVVVPIVADLIFGNSFD